LYLEGWKAGLKGLATYRPNSVIGSVLSTDVPAAAATSTQAPPAAAQATVPAGEDPLRKQFDSRPAGSLRSESEKVELWTMEGKRSLYVIASFMDVDGVVNGEKVTIERPIEFFLEGGKRDAGQQWMDMSTRMLSMVARSGGSIAKTIENMREVSWDKGTVRSGYLVKADGTKIPRQHDSEVAAIGYAIQQMLIRRGFLDELGRQVPVAKLAALRGAQKGAEPPTPAPQPVASAKEHFPPGTGGTCPDCGAHDVHHVDGCTLCTACGYIGACG
jgi:ribonucleoside-diphosphate reductase alpha chain